VLADSYRIAAKALRPLPVAHKAAVREGCGCGQRYVDSDVRPEGAGNGAHGARVLRSIRETLDRGGYLEVETPALQLVHGGATARPFRTHLNAFDQDMSLRIAIGALSQTLRRRGHRPGVRDGQGLS